MAPIYFTLLSHKQLTIIPDSQAHLDGHEIITYTYSVYVDRKDGSTPAYTKETALHLQDNPDPDYYGFIAFEKPGSLFSYTADGSLELTPEESTEVIEHISQIRDDGGWKTESSPNQSS